MIEWFNIENDLQNKVINLQLSFEFKWENLKYFFELPWMKWMV